MNDFLMYFVFLAWIPVLLISAIIQNKRRAREEKRIRYVERIRKHSSILFVLFVFIGCGGETQEQKMSPYIEHVICVNKQCEVYTDVSMIEICTNTWNDTLTDFVLDCSIILD